MKYLMVTIIVLFATKSNADKNCSGWNLCNPWEPDAIRQRQIDQIEREQIYQYGLQWNNKRMESERQRQLERRIMELEQRLEDADR